MTAVAETAAHEATRTTFCVVPGCPEETRGGRDYCDVHRHLEPASTPAPDSSRPLKAPAEPPAEAGYVDRRGVAWTREAAEQAVRQLAAELGRTPGVSCAGATGVPTETAAKALYGSWRGLVAAAGLPAPQVGRPPGIVARRPVTEAAALDAVRAFAERAGGAPTRREALVDASLPTEAAARKLFGSWAAMVERAGLPRPTTGSRRAARPRDGSLLHSAEAELAHLDADLDRLRGELDRATVRREKLAKVVEALRELGELEGAG